MKAKDFSNLEVLYTVGDYSFVADGLYTFWIKTLSLETEVAANDYESYSNWCSCAYMSDADCPYSDPREVEFDKIVAAAENDAETMRREGETDGTYTGISQQGEESAAGNLINALGWDVIGSEFGLPIFDQDTGDLMEDSDDPEIEKIKTLFCSVYTNAFDAIYYSED